MNMKARKTSEIEYSGVVPFVVYDKNYQKRAEISKIYETYRDSKYAYQVYYPNGMLQLDATLSSSRVSDTKAEESYDQFVLCSEEGKELYRCTRKNKEKKWKTQYWDGEEMKSKTMTSEELDEVWQEYKKFHFTIQSSSVIAL